MNTEARIECVDDTQRATPRRIALVTGASRGIGRAICAALAAQGCEVAVNYVHSPELAEATVELCQQTAAHAGHQGSRFVAVQGDVATVEGCESLFQQTVDVLGAPDILVNNAGITRDNLILRMSIEDFESVLDVNLRSAFLLSKLATRPMIKKRYGRIINISSIVGVRGNAGQANYASSKAGLIGLTQSLAKELGSRAITVNAIAPGFIETRMTESLSPAQRDELSASISLRRIGTPEEVAHAVAFLASDAASYITGHVLAVDGGLTL